ncbi:hypothetical protein QJQ45_007776 [Haematococcus lacustris]|nr:hypothetical protein QJQ45_007776 [Haematococcus lacustris]
MMWCPVVAPRKPPQAPCSSQAATQPAASEPGPSTPLPAKGKGQGQGKAAKAKPAPKPDRAGKLSAKGKEYPGLGYKRVQDKPPEAQQQQQQQQQPAGPQ